MKTYNFKLIRTYQTKFQLTADSEADARRKFDEIGELEITKIERGQYDIISSVFEVDEELTNEEKAQKWFESRGMIALINESESLTLIVCSNDITYYVEVSSDEMYMRAKLWELETR